MTLDRWTDEPKRQLIEFGDESDWNGVYRMTECRRALAPSGLPEMDYNLNPYGGCEHGCVYCYAMQGSGVPANPSVDSGSPLLASCLCDEDRVTERPVPKLEEAGPELF